MNTKDTIKFIPEQVQNVLKNKNRIRSFLTNTELIIGLLLAVYVVTLLWGYFTKGSYALGFNATIFYLIFLVYFFIGIENKKEYFLKNFYFVIPFIVLALSFSLYENPYLQTINSIVFPLLLLIFLGLSLVKFPNSKKWSFELFGKILGTSLPLEKTYLSLLQEKDKFSSSKTIVAKKVVKAVAILIALNFFIIILLASADKNFLHLISNFIPSIDITIIYRLGLLFISLLIFYAMKYRWKSEVIFHQEEVDKKIDLVIASIILIGTLVVYLLFISVQIESLFGSETLSGNLQIVSHSAKSGFWQLFVVSIINVILFYTFYSKKYLSLRVYLGLFLTASFIILLSAATRMFNYVSEFGLSYEKFTASYTLLFIGVLFIGLLLLLFTNKKQDILKFGVILTLSMYALLNLLPMEGIIYNFNLEIAKQENNQLDPYNSHMLSYDIKDKVENLKSIYPEIFRDQSWSLWLNKQEQIKADKKWYEMNVSNILK